MYIIQYKDFHRGEKTKMKKKTTETISFGKEYEPEHLFLLNQSKGNKSYYMCELLRKERLLVEGEDCKNE
jgi:hypothetical protein